MTLATVLSLLLVLTALAACGGNEEQPETAQVGETAATEPAVIEEPTAAIAPTIAPPTEAPPEPTAAPPATEIAEPVALEGNCDNAFFPIIEGRALTYRSNLAGLGESTYTTTTSDVTESSFNLATDIGDGEVLVNTWTCTGEGMLSPEFTQLPGGMEGLSIEFVEAEGVTIPSEDLLRSGGEWTTHYVANATMGDTGAGAMTMVQTIDLNNTVVGIEAVSVPAGDYPEAIRVESVGTIAINMAVGDQAPAVTHIDMSYTSWYVEDIGMVRQDFSGLFGEAGAGDSVTELLAIE